jgi:propionyl-CoA carboxylase alpha chain
MTTVNPTPFKPIRSVLIANRGEIARRIIRTCKRLGLKTVAIYTEPDRDLPFVAEADEAIALGAPNAYLDLSAVLDAVRKAKVDAVHPGYGFLSENPEFVEQLTGVGVRFIGPSAAAMRLLGNKSNAKGIATAAQVPISPTRSLDGLTGEKLSETIRSFGHEVGFPLILKAASGGGGRGMRIVGSDSDFLAEFSSAQREAERAFGGSSIFVEKCISPARHIEVQLIADQLGNVTTLGTRDCSLQRNHQKIIEEACAPNLPEGVSDAMCAAAERLAVGAHYTNIGTVEFLLAPDGSFFFLEVNSRIQVEHPVTEMITGVDLVEVQIRIAEGVSLKDLNLIPAPVRRGHAIEARICAEAFDDALVISTGTITKITIPTVGNSSPGVPSTLRYEFGFTVGSSVSHNYDSLIGKLVAWGNTRNESIQKLTHALSILSISGVRTNKELVLHLLATPEFLTVQHSIQGTKDLLPSRECRNQRVFEAVALCAALRLCRFRNAATTPSSWGDALGWGLGAPLTYPWSCDAHGLTLSTQTSVSNGLFVVAVRDGTTLTTVRFVCEHFDEVHQTATVTFVGERSEKLSWSTAGDTYWLHRSVGSWCTSSSALASRATKAGGSDSEITITSPLPGKVAAIAAVQGSMVDAGQTIVVLDSMKMEHPIRSPVAGRLTHIVVQVGEVVSAGKKLATVVTEK